MPANAHDAYLETAILSADPLELVRILYRTALDSVREAKVHTGSGNIAARAKSVSRSLDVIAELIASLNHDAGGPLSRRLGELYDYMQWRLIEANCRQTTEPLDEVSALLSTLLEAWQSIGRVPKPPEAGHFEADLMQLASLRDFQVDAECASRSWSA